MEALERFPVQNGRTTFGMHMMLDAYGVPHDALDDMKNVFAFLNNLPDAIGMSKLSAPVVVDADETASGYDPGGITGFILIKESHIAIHTFSKRGFFTMDTYSCSNFEDQLSTLLAYIKEYFPYQEHELQIIKRGLNYPTENIHHPDKK